MNTFFDKVWNSRVIAELGGGMCLLQVDRLILQDVSGATVMREMREAGHAVACPQQVFVISDHLATTVPGSGPRTGWTPIAVKVLAEVTQLSRALGVQLIDADDPRGGIAHVVAPELAIALPGLAIACGDSHTCTLGGLGALAWGIGTSEGSHALATQTLIQVRPKTMRIVFDGALPAQVSAKDMALALIARFGAGFGSGHAVEFAGTAVRALSVEARMTLCNMAIEFAAKYGFVAPDQTTFDYLQGRDFAPRGEAWDRAVAHWRTLHTDEGARFDAELRLDASALRPQVTWGTSPQHACAVDDVVPAPGEFADRATRELAQRALDYQQLAPGTRLEDVAIDVAYIGTCTNARLSDLRAAADLLRGHKVARGVTAICVPGSTQVKAAAEAEGLDQVFRDAGFEWHEAGCAMCGSGRGRLEDVRVIGTTNRNFENRQGRATRTHLASPATVAASAIAGHIADPRHALSLSPSPRGRGSKTQCPSPR